MSTKKGQKSQRKESRSALLIIDVQNDFAVEGGKLLVPKGVDVVPVCNRLRSLYSWTSIVLTQDWHPQDHMSFHDNNGKKPFSSKKFDINGEEIDQASTFHPLLGLACKCAFVGVFF